MEKKQKLFIYDRKEMIVLLLLGVVVSAFAFTLGVHLGKRVTPPLSEQMAQKEAQEEQGTEALPATEEALPDQAELNDKAAQAARVADAAMEDTLKDEVNKTGIQVETPKAVSLPSETKHTESQAAHRETKHSEPKESAKAQGSASAPVTAKKAPAPSAASPSSSGGFAIQVGSFPSESEAQTAKDEFDSQGQSSVLRPVDLGSKGRWFRVLVGNYPTPLAAQKAGNQLKAEGKISSFVVSPR
jgi:cell division protein FtsN